MKSNAQASARQTLDYVKCLEREIRRLRRDRDALETSLMAAKTAGAHLRDELAHRVELNISERAQMDEALRKARSAAFAAGQESKP